MSSPKKRRTQGFNRGKKNDPEGEGVEDEEMRSLVGRTLGTTLGVEEDEGIEQLLRDSERKGLQLRQGSVTVEDKTVQSSDIDVEPGWLKSAVPARRTSLEERPVDEGLERESPISQCLTGERLSAEDIGRVACIEKPAMGRTTMLPSSQMWVESPDRPTFRASRKGRADVLEASWRQAFEDCRHNLARVCRKKGASFGELGDVVAEALKGQETGFSRCSQATGDLFPLPLPSSLGRTFTTPPCVDALVQALNSLYGTKTVSRTREDKTRLTLVDRLEKVVVRSGLAQEILPEMDFERFFESKGVDYSGEEVQVARRFRWHMIEAAFPEAVGSLDLEEFCDGGTLSYIRNFESFMLPVEDQYVGKAPTIMVETEHWPQVCSGLLRRGVCRAMHVSEIHHVGEKPLLNGMFAVGKSEFAVDAEGVEFEVCRLIMNLVPTNSCCRSLTGDTSTLPSVIGMSSIVLEDHQLLVTSSEDIRCFFYLFRTPPSWWKFMAFGREIPHEALPVGCSGGGWHLVTQVLPMGFINSVAIAQHIHRRVISQALRNDQRLASGHQEIRRDRPHSSAPHLFRVYLDNYDELKKVDRTLASTIAGTPSAWTLAVRATYESLGLPRHPKKAVTQEARAEVQGAWVDGELGHATPKVDKILRYVRLACEALIAGKASQRELQVIGGGFVYMAMFRRPLLAGLNAIWRRIVELGTGGGRQRATLGCEVAHELLRFIALAPLAYMDFRTQVSEKVTASDASTTGGGLCVSRELSPYGMAASLATCRGDIITQDEVGSILVVSLFDGIGALRVAVDALRVPVAGYVSVEICPEARRVVESWFPEVVHMEDVASVGDDAVQEWCLRFPSVVAVLLGAGPPCQGVSGLNVDRRGALRDARSCLFSHVPRIEQAIRRWFTWCPVFTLIENVASMDAGDCSLMNSAYGLEPWLVDASGISLPRRPRLYWFNWDPRSMVGLTDYVPVASEG